MRSVGHVLLYFIAVRSREIHLGVLTSWQGDVLSYPETLLGVLPALRAVNEDSRILPSDELTFVWADTQCTHSSAVQAAAGLLKLPVDAIIGPLCSNDCFPIEPMTHMIDIPTISYCANHPELSDKRKYPAFFRTVGSTSMYDSLIIRFLRHLGFSHAALVYPVDSRLALGWASTMRSALDEDGFNIDAEVPYKTFGQPQVETLLSRGARVFLSLDFDCTRTRELLLTARDNGILEGSTWITGYCGYPPPDSLGLFNGLFTVSSHASVHPSVLDAFDAEKDQLAPFALPFSGTSSRAAAADANPLGLHYSLEQVPRSTHYSAFLYDAILLYGHAAHAVRSAGGSLRNISAMREALASTSFPGATGNVTLDANGDRLGSAGMAMLAMNAQGTKLLKTKVCTFSSASGSFEMLVPDEKLVFAGGATAKPRDHVTTCPAGTYTPAGTRSCSPCLPGSFAAGRGFERGSCALCEPGKAQADPQQAQCVDCQAGTSARSRGANVCQPCPAGTYASKRGASVCEPCRATYGTVKEGSASPANCTCTGRTYLDPTTSRCTDCSALMGLLCRGGLELPRVADGHMTLRGEPLSVYRCVEGSARCPGARSWAAGGPPMCAAGFDPEVAQCSRCLEDHYLSRTGACVQCESGNMVFNTCKLAGTYLIQLAVVVYMYVRFNRPCLSGAIMMGHVITFVQTLQSLGMMTLKWPATTSSMFKAFDVFTVPGIVYALDFRLECFTGDTVTLRLLRDALSPLLIFIDFAVLGVIFRVARFSNRFNQHLSFNTVANVIGVWFSKLFISISRLTMALFFTDRMPSGKSMVKAMPEVEFGSEQWVRIAPVAIVSCAVYCGGLIAVVAHAVWKAPRWAAEWPGFEVRYRFAFGALRTDRWWWALCSLVYGFFINFVHVLSNNAHSVLYLSVLTIGFFTAAETWAMPLKFRDSNHVGLALKLSLLAFLMMSTSFIDHGALPRDYLDQQNESFGRLTLATFCAAIAFTIYCVAKWALQMSRPAGVRTGHAARVLWRFRDTVLAQAALTEHEVLQRVVKLEETDLRHLERAMRTVVTTLFGQQFSPARWRQRVIPGVEYAVWDYSAMTATLIRQIQSGQFQQAIRENCEARLRMLCLARHLRSRLPGRSTIVDEVGYRIRSSEVSMIRAANIPGERSCTFEDFMAQCRQVGYRQRPSKASMIQATSVVGEGKFTVEGFIQFCTQVTRNELTPTDSELLFNLLDADGDGFVWQHELVIALRGLAPRGLQHVSDAKQEKEVGEGDEEQTLHLDAEGNSLGVRDSHASSEDGPLRHRVELDSDDPSRRKEFVTL